MRPLNYLQEKTEKNKQKQHERENELMSHRTYSLTNSLTYAHLLTQYLRVTKNWLSRYPLHR